MKGKPTHFEMGAGNSAQAQSFFSELLGWTMRPMQGDNAWIETNGVRGGLHDEDPSNNIVVYFEVDDIEAAAAKVNDLGGHAPEPGPTEKGFGRFVECRDNQGIVFGIHEAEAPEK